MECSICLEELNDKKTIFTLSCNHKLHYQCFLKYVYQKNNIYIDCPLCREMNTNNKSPLDDPKEGLKELLLLSPKNKRCCQITQSGKRCKKNSSLMNSGYCSVHHKNILPEIKYDLMNRYILYILQINSRWYTKIHMIDFIKKILIKYPEIKTLDEVLTYGWRYKFHRQKMALENETIERCDINEYYGLDDPTEEWIHKCMEDKIIHS